MIKPKLLVKGNFTPNDLVVSVSPSDLVILDSVKEDIEEIWKTKLKESKEKNLNLYNGNIYRLNTFKEENGKIYLDCGIRDFKTRVGLIEVLFKIDYNENTHHHGCYVGANV
jgi:hypothetical protein